MCKRFVYILMLSLLIVPVILQAQDEELDELDFEEQDYEEFMEETQSYVVFGGGFIINMHMIENTAFKSINDVMKSNNFVSGDNHKLSGLFYQFGAQGIVTVGLVPNLRIGIIGMSGSSSLSDPIKIESPNVERNFTFSSGYTGVTIDYAFVPFRDFSLAILPGVTFGYGEMALNASQTTDTFDWNDINPNQTNNTYNYQLETSYWHIEPMLYFEYAPTIVSLFRVGVGYSMALGNKWYMNGNSDAKVENVPDELSVSGLNIQLGILLGIFNY